MDKKMCAATLVEMTDLIGFPETLSQFPLPAKIKINMSQELWDTPITQDLFKARSYNGLKRASLETIGMVSERIMTETGLSNVRMLGVKSINEIKQTIATMAYEQLSQKEKCLFWEEFLELNRY